MGAVAHEHILLDALEIEVAARPAPRESECGDRFCALTWPTGVVVAVVDGLGHGPNAAAAALGACTALHDAPAGLPLPALVQRCHGALRRTRGAAISLAFFSPSPASIDWLAVGNVEGVVMHAAARSKRDTIIQRPGIVGRNLPPLRSNRIQISPGDTLMLATDGIATDFASRLASEGMYPPNADHILDRYATGADDALVLVARYGEAGR